MSSRTSSLMGGLPPADLCAYVHFLRTSSRCQRRSVRGLTMNDDHRARERALLIAAMNTRSRRRRRGLPTRALQLMAQDNDLGAHLFVGRTNDQPDHMVQQQIHGSPEHKRNLPREGGPMVRTLWSRRRSMVCAPFTGLRALASVWMQHGRVAICHVRDP